jgi:bifunctional DNA-binding transcriptional regulator/antitoxin component of YhaV-PrlF toxin-antitoxin module
MALEFDERERVALPRVEAESELRHKNQITVPKAIIDAIGARPGDRLVFVVPNGYQDTFVAVRVRDDYAGSMAGVYGTPDEVKDYLRGEAEVWEE